MKKILFILLFIHLFNITAQAQETETRLSSLKDSINITTKSISQQKEISLGLIQDISFENQKSLKDKLRLIQRICDDNNLDSDGIKTIVSDFNVYSEGKKYITECAYKEDSVKTITSKFKVAIDRQKDGTVRKRELTEIYDKLEDYEYATETFNDFKEAINQIKKDNPNKKKAIEAIQKEIKQQKEDGYIQEIESIPYLQKNYNEYINKLSTQYSYKFS